MKESFDKEKILSILFDSNVSEILGELENGGKESLYLAEKFKIPEAKVRQHLSYLIEHGFVKETKEGTKTIFSANTDKLAKIMENDKNFERVVDGLTEMDSYLN